MDKRSEVFQLFGPKLLEGFLNLILIQLNILRQANGLPEITKLQAYEEIMNDTLHLPDFDWMD